MIFRNLGSAGIEIHNKRMVFVLVIATTDVSLIPGITVAGASPELTHYTPAADAEFLMLGVCKSIRAIPITPEGIPTPALITKAMIRRLNLPILVVNAGARIKPQIPYLELNGAPGRDIRDKRGAIDYERAKELFENSHILGRELSKTFDLVFIAESVPGGTTTAMATLEGLGVKAMGKVSSSSPINPIEIKAKVVEEALRVHKGNNPLETASKLGDPMIIASSGIALGLSEGGKTPLFSGGTQMIAVYALYKLLGGKGGLILTSKWIREDKSSNILDLAKQVEVDLIFSEFSLRNSKFIGLRKYEEGYVKEGVGMGASLILARERGIGEEEILKDIDKQYEETRNLML
jgi:uncharacterized protein (TIGR00303 family)